MSNNKNKSKWIVVGGWIVSIIVAIIGTFVVTSYSQSQQQEQSQEQKQEQNQSQNIVLNIDGKEVSINGNNAQSVYNELEEKVHVADEMLTNLQNKIDSLEETNNALSIENEKYKSYGTDALVSREKNYDANKVSLLAFSTVNAGGWNPNEGTLKDSLDNNYSVTLPYIIIGGGSYAEYYPNKEYKTLEFKIAPHVNMEQAAVSQVKVYADDILVFTSHNIDRKTEMKTYSVDINNAKFIKVTCERISGYGNSSVLFLDSTLIK